MVAGTVRDVTTERAAAHRSHEERHRFRVLIEQSQDGVFMIRDGRLVSVNRAFADPLGYTVSELDGVDYRRLVAPEDCEVVEHRYEDRIRGGNPPAKYEFQLLHKDGVTRIPVRMHVGLADLDGTPVSIGTMRLLTDEAGASAAYKHLLTHSAQGMALIQGHRFALINPAFADILGYTAADLESTDSSTLIHPDDRAAFVVPNDDSNNVQLVRVVHKNGSYRMLDINSIRTAYRGRPALAISFHDVTDRAVEQEQRLAAESCVASLIASSPAPMFLKDEALRYTHINEHAQRVLGLPKGSPVGQRDDALLPEADALRSLEADRSALDGNPAVTEHASGSASTGSFHTLHRVPVRNSEDEVVGVAGIGINVTDSRRLKHAMTDSKKTLRGALDAVPIGILIMEPITARRPGDTAQDYRVVHSNQAARSMLGLPADNTAALLLSDLFADSWQYGLAERIDTVASTGQGSGFEQIVCVDGVNSQWLSMTVSRIHDRVALTFSDTTSSRQAIEALRRSEQNYREIFDCSTSAIFVHDASSGEITDVNKAVCEMFRGQREDLLRLKIEDISEGGPHYSQEQAVQMVRRAFEQGRHSFEWHARRLDGDLFWVEVTLVRAVVDGDTAVLAFVRDISDRKRAEGGLTASEKRFRAVFEHSGIGILLAHGNGSMLRTNPAFCRFGGYDDGDTRELNIFDLLHRSDQRRFHRQIGRLQKRVRPRVQLHVRLRRRDGSYYWAGVTASLLPGSGEASASGSTDSLVLYMITDISAQRRAEAILRDTEEGFRALAESIPHLVWSLDAAGLPEYCNTRVFEYYGTSGQPADLPEWHVHLHPDDATTQRPAWKRCLSTGHEYVAECRLLRAGDQAYRWQLVRFVPVRNASGEINRWFGTGTDVHDARDARERVEELVELERGLRRELDHRVRNNLTSLITLIDLAGQTARDANECAGSIRARAQTMATIHSLLTRSGDRTVELRAILMAFVPRDCKGTIDINGPEVRLNPSQADKIGLITNELMTNSLEYGTLGIRGGTVSIQWHIEQQHDARPEVCIWWREQGGMNQPDAASPGSGTKIIEGLVRFDLNGVVDLRYPPEGANHRLRFRLEPAAPGVISM